MTVKQSMFKRTALTTAMFMALAGIAQAQVSTATIKGQITKGANAAQPGTPVVAVNQANGNTYRSSTLADGNYVLSGLAPGVYEIRITDGGGAIKSQLITVQVGETAAVNLTIGTGSATNLNTVTVVGNAQRQGVRDSQVGTNVSQKMISALPQLSHNFMSAADLAPGVGFVTTNAEGYTKIQSGSQSNDHVNVFIDGVGQKNNILQGGISGQSNTRGNTFPQSAIAEYKVLTQNYKAEFEQVSSAAITAVTKSGGNELHGEVYVDRTGTNWRQKSEFEKAREDQGLELLPSTKNEYGFSLGGPIVEDKVHFFIAVDGKNINDSKQASPRNLDRLPAGKGIVPSVKDSGVSRVTPFKEQLFFGKIDAQLNDEQKLSFSVRLRNESDRVAESVELSGPGNEKNRKNDETRIDLKHEWAMGNWLSEARIGYEKYVFNPLSASTDPFIKYKASTSTPPKLSNSSDVIYLGGSPDAQYRGQSGTYVSEDLTYTGFNGHVIKGGAKLKAMAYELSGTSRSVDVVETVIDSTSGLPYYDGKFCTGSNVTNGGLQSDQCSIQPAIAGASVSFKNNQLGLYLQDDWAVTRQLELNLGVRYDYESNMLNNSYATPADRVAALRGLDGTRWNITPPAGQTYAQSLAKGGVNIEEFISTGSSRKVFDGAIAPRVGASYDLFGDLASVLFTGWGRAYDRTMANHALDEMQKNAVANGEIWLIKNDFKMPYADQFTFGLRQAVGIWNAEISYNNVAAKNQFIWYGGNRDANGGWATQSPIDPLWNGPNGYGTLVLGDFVGETRTQSVFVKLEKPFTAASGWSMNVAYTYSDAETTNKEWTNDIFDWTYGRATHGWNPSQDVDKHRIVVAGVSDSLLPWGMSVSGKLTWASGLEHKVTSCAAGWDKCMYVPGELSPFKQVDVSLSKEFKLSGANRVGVRLDVLNLLNTTNYGGRDDWGGGPVAAGQPANAVGGDNLNLGKPNGLRGDMRTLRLALNYKF